MPETAESKKPATAPKRPRANRSVRRVRADGAVIEPNRKPDRTLKARQERVVQRKAGLLPPVPKKPPAHALIKTSGPPPWMRPVRPRKRIEITERELRNLAAWQATFDECCAWFNCSHSTLADRMREFPELRVAWDEGHKEGLHSLRRRQLEIAFSDSPQAAQMLIHLGKTILGQSEKQIHEHLGQGGGPIRFSEVRRTIVEANGHAHPAEDDEPIPVGNGHDIEPG